MIDYKEIGDFIENKIEDPQRSCNWQLVVIADERAHHPDKMTDKECTAYAKAMILSHQIRDTDQQAAELKKNLAKQCLERKPNEDQLATLVVAGNVNSVIEDDRFLPPFYALYKKEFLNEYQNSCNIISATAKYGEYHKKIFGDDASSVAIDTLEKMLKINYEQSTIVKDDAFFDKKRPYHLSDIKSSIILDLLGKQVDKDYSDEHKISEILSNLAQNKAFQAAVDRHPALAITFTNVGEKCITAAAKRKRAQIFEGYGLRLQQIAEKQKVQSDKTHSNLHTR